MGKQLYYEDVAVGDALPALQKEITNVNILMYCATVWLMDRIHFDHLFATQSRGLPDIVAPGNMAGDYFSQLLTEWAGDRGSMKKLGIQFRNFMVPGNVLDCGGKVTGKYVNEGKGYVELELWLKNTDGVNCVPGSGLVELPMQG